MKLANVDELVARKDELTKAVEQTESEIEDAKRIEAERGPKRQAAGAEYTVAVERLENVIASYTDALEATVKKAERVLKARAAMEAAKRALTSHGGEPGDFAVVPRWIHQREGGRQLRERALAAVQQVL